MTKKSLEKFSITQLRFLIAKKKKEIEKIEKVCFIKYGDRKKDVRLATMFVEYGKRKGLDIKQIYNLAVMYKGVGYHQDCKIVNDWDAKHLNYLPLRIKSKTTKEVEKHFIDIYRFLIRRYGFTNYIYFFYKIGICKAKNQPGYLIQARFAEAKIQ